MMDLFLVSLLLWTDSVNLPNRRHSALYLQNVNLQPCFYRRSISDWLKPIYVLYVICPLRYALQDMDKFSLKDSGRGDSEAGDSDCDMGRESPVDRLLLGEGFSDLIHLEMHHRLHPGELTVMWWCLHVSPSDSFAFLTTTCEIGLTQLSHKANNFYSSTSQSTITSARGAKLHLSIILSCDKKSYFSDGFSLGLSNFGPIELTEEHTILIPDLSFSDSETKSERPNSKEWAENFLLPPDHTRHN